jgi:DNA-binding beta-propeller fold protein YncE
MKRLSILCFLLVTFQLHAGNASNLQLIKTVPLPDVRGRIDHFAIDVKGQRLFMAALGNDTIEVIDLAAGKRIHTITGCSEPQGLAFVPTENRLIIANGGSGEVKILDGSSFKTVKVFAGMSDADNVRYDAKANLIYVGYGDGALGVINATNWQRGNDINLAGHPESFQLEQNGNRIFVNVPDAGHIAVIDRLLQQVIATWPLGDFHANFPMALDEDNHRLFIGCRRPARLLGLDTTTGKRVTDLEISGDTDDLFYNPARKEIYVSCGAGFIQVISQKSADSYSLREKQATASGARTSFFCPARNELYLAVRAGMISGKAEVRIFKIADK